MKTCAYCGRGNEDSVTQCRECGGSSFQNLPVAETEPALKMDFDPLKKEEMDHTWVTLLRCRNVIEADMIAMRLRAVDIPVFIPDEFFMQAISFNVNTYGFVRLQVPPSQYEAAREILSATGISEPEPKTL